MAKHDMYKDSPKMEHDGEGKVAVKKAAKKDAKEDKKDGEGKKESASSGLDVHAAHHEELKEMHKRHHTEMKDMQARHETEAKSMHTKHEKEAGATSGSDDVGAPIGKVEKGAKS